MITLFFPPTSATLEILAYCDTRSLSPTHLHYSHGILALDVEHENIFTVMAEFP